jgi:hypothetical protein
MKKVGRVRFWHMMVGTGFALLAIGLLLIFLPSGVGDTDPYLIEFFEARVEGSEMGLALIVLGLSCFLIGRKDLADLRAYQELEQGLDQTTTLAAKLVAERVNRTINQLPARSAGMVIKTDLDLETTRHDLLKIQNGGAAGQSLSKTIHQAERGLELLEVLEKEGYSI